MINSNNLTGAIAALLEEYKKAIDELIAIISPLNPAQLTAIVNPDALDEDVRSIQNILSHVVASTYSYTVYIENWIGLHTVRPNRYVFDNVKDYIEKLNSGFSYCENCFLQNRDIPLEEFDNNKKINTRWGQQYDVEQLMEHAIVHILRHRRQIQNIIKRNQPA
ncbi:DinB family protein [Pedobacter punctiformis]|uniref:DinB family protein n=1 Tax=Pedobacter punctiformis TaxID=3004097 RepID=A0ABT4LBP6_9SPHI|nr:DinB family protein [Pedobacter sp. HCMS5-2]MCZ4245341.1 DinB family protein [Pedobacter sp. HCMS5-2]